MKQLLRLALLIPALALSQTGQGLVSGSVRTPTGVPAQGVRVAAMPVQGNSEPVVLESLAATDTSGNFRIERITPGQYYIVAGLVSAPTYFPGTPSRENARIVTVTAGTPVTGIEFSLLSSSISHRVSGRVTGLPPGSRRSISLLPTSATPGGGRVPKNSMIGADGTFSIADVPPGDYTIVVVGMILPKPAMVTIDGSDVLSLEISVQDPGAITTQQGLTAAWYVEGAFRGIAFDDRAGVLHAARAGRRVQIDSTGKILGDHPFTLSSPTLRVARFSAGTPAFLSFGTWSPRVDAVDASGSTLWSYPENGQGIDDVWPADLDGDGVDEVIVGFNGSTGMHVLNAAGKLLWQSTGIGNVWHVAAGDVMGDGKARVVSTSAQGRVHVFGTDGKSRQDLQVGLYANMVRVAKLSAQDSRATILVAGNPTGAPNMLGLAAVTSDGGSKWSLQLAAPTPSARSMSIAVGSPWVAVGIQGGLVYVVDAERGSVLASIDGQGFSPEVAWMKEGGVGPPLLVVSTPNKLNAYRVK